MQDGLSGVTHYLFDVFGTCVDAFGSIVRRAHAAGVADPKAMAEEWISSYGRAVVDSEGWTNLDELLAGAFYEMAPKFVSEDMPAGAYAVLSNAWNRLDAWPDAVQGLTELSLSGEVSGRFATAAFSNANNDMLRAVVGYAGLPFSRLLSAESCKRYKPDPLFYREAVKILGAEPGRICLAASHCFDINAARKEGIRTILVERAGEPGSSRKGLDHEPALIVPDIVAMAAAIHDVHFRTEKF